MEKEAASRKMNKNPSKPEPDGLKVIATKWKKPLEVEKQKKKP